MKKVLIAFDGPNFSKGAFHFASEMNKAQPILLTGIFLPQLEYAYLWSYAASTSAPLFVPLVEEEDAEQIRQNIEQFKARCKAANIEYRLHKDFWDPAIVELQKETRYADLLILGSETFYSHLSNAQLSLYLQDALHEAECPVVVVPEEFTYPQSNILAYDGTASSVFAIKQFSYLFPELIANPTTLTYATDKSKDRLPEKSNIEELVCRRFSDLEFLNLELDLKKYFSTWLSEKQGAILVCGSFGRSGLSKMLRRSFVADVISDHKLPVFVTHK